MKITKVPQKVETIQRVVQEEKYNIELSKEEARSLLNFLDYRSNSSISHSVEFNESSRYAYTYSVSVGYEDLRNLEQFINQLNESVKA